MWFHFKETVSTFNQDAMLGTYVDLTLTFIEVGETVTRL
jgi:hypothetical protein